MQDANQAGIGGRPAGRPCLYHNFTEQKRSCTAMFFHAVDAAALALADL